MLSIPKLRLKLLKISTTARAGVARSRQQVSSAASHVARLEGSLCRLVRSYDKHQRQEKELLSTVNPECIEAIRAACAAPTACSSLPHCAETARSFTSSTISSIPKSVLRRACHLAKAMATSRRAILSIEDRIAASRVALRERETHLARVTYELEEATLKQKSVSASAGNAVLTLQAGGADALLSQIQRAAALEDIDMASTCTGASVVFRYILSHYGGDVPPSPSLVVRSRRAGAVVLWRPVLAAVGHFARRIEVEGWVLQPSVLYLDEPDPEDGDEYHVNIDDVDGPMLRYDEPDPEDGDEYHVNIDDVDGPMLRYDEPDPEDGDEVHYEEEEDVEAGGAAGEETPRDAPIPRLLALVSPRLLDKLAAVPWVRRAAFFLQSLQYAPCVVSVEGQLRGHLLNDDKIMTILHKCREQPPQLGQLLTPLHASGATFCGVSFLVQLLKQWAPVLSHSRAVYRHTIVAPSHKEMLSTLPWFGPFKARVRAEQGRDLIPLDYKLDWLRRHHPVHFPARRTFGVYTLLSGKTLRFDVQKFAEILLTLYIEGVDSAFHLTDETKYSLLFELEWLHDELDQIDFLRCEPHVPSEVLQHFIPRTAQSHKMSNFGNDQDDVATSNVATSKLYHVGADSDVLMISC